MKKFFVLAFALLLTACGSKLEGTYSSPSGLSFTFHDGKVSMGNLLGGKMEVPFTTEGNLIKFKFQGGGNAVVLTQNPDGSLNGNGLGLGKFTKQ